MSKRPVLLPVILAMAAAAGMTFPPPPLPKPRTVWPTDPVPTEPQAPRESKAAMRRRKQIERGVIKP